MTKQELQEAIARHIEAGEQILQNEQNNFVYDVPVMFGGRMEQLWAQYKGWREGYDKLLEEIIKSGASITFQPIPANQEAISIHLYAEPDDIYRDTKNAFKKHINELKGIQI